MRLARIVSQCFLFALLLTWFGRVGAQTVQNTDRICGKWMSSEKNLQVDVYKTGDEYKARIIWFRDDTSKPMDEWRDSHNPDPALRNRRILGMDVVRGLKYDKDNDSWEDGIVYDAKQGREWSAAAYIDEHGLLRVRGYWHFKLFGKTMVFKRP
jgi:uncharacterized protein (DUF2147 family)